MAAPFFHVQFEKIEFFLVQVGGEWPPDMLTVLSALELGACAFAGSLGYTQDNIRTPDIPVLGYVKFTLV